MNTNTNARIVLELVAFNKLKITEATSITINNHPMKRRGGWSLAEIIETAAFEIKEKHPDGEVLAYGEWHDQIFLERFEQTDANRFELGFGS